MIRRVFLAVAGYALAFTGLASFGYWLTAEPGFGPHSIDMAFAYIVLGIALGGSGIYLIRLSLKREEPR